MTLSPTHVILLGALTTSAALTWSCGPTGTSANAPAAPSGQGALGADATSTDSKAPDAAISGVPSGTKTKSGRKSLASQPSPSDTSATTASGAAVDDGDRKTAALVGATEADQLITADFAQLPPRAQSDVRYVTLAQVASSTPENLHLAQFGVEKVVNSLSLAPRMVKLDRVDSNGVVLRLSMASLTWTPAVWQRLATAEANNGHVRQLPSGAIVVDGDWLVFAATRPETYDKIIGIPQLETINEARIGAANEDGVYLGITKSIVAFNGRVLRRRSINYGDHQGYYWRSYDFAVPGAAETAMKKGEPTYANSRGIPDLIAGEFIWSLPNGMQAYMLSGFGAQHRYDAVAQVARDTRREDRLVINGESCFACHARGLNTRQDEIGPYLRANAANFSSEQNQRFARLFPEPATLDKIFADDNAQFAKAIAALGYEDIDSEPIAATVELFKTRTGYRDVRKQRGDTDAVLGN